MLQKHNILKGRREINKKRGRVGEEEGGRGSRSVYWGDDEQKNRAEERERQNETEGEEERKVGSVCVDRGILNK